MATWKDPHEEAITSAVSLDAPWALVERFSKLVRDSGGKSEGKAIDYIVRALSRWGIPHTLHEPEVLISLPRRARLGVIAPERRTLTAKTPSMSKSTNGYWQRGNLIYVPASPASNIRSLFEGLGKVTAEVEGRVALTEGYPMPAKVAELQVCGAVAAIFISPGERIHEGICTTIWGSPDLDSVGRKPNIPVLTINKTEGEWLRELCQRSPVRVRYSTKLDEGYRPIPVLVTEIRGTDEPEKFVLLHGHIDSWHGGVGDNATGDATLLEVARVLWQHRTHLRRSVRIAWWSGHSHGRYAGSTWYADAFALDLDEHCVVHINCDSPGCRDASVFDDVFWMSEAAEIAQRVVRDVTGLAATGGRPSRAGDMSFSNIGVSTFYMLSSTMPKALSQEKGYYPVGGCGGNIAWHTEDDTLEVADPDNLLRDIKIYAVASFRAANSSVYPLNFRATAQELATTLVRYHEAAAPHVDLRPAIQEAEALEGDLARFYDELEDVAKRPLTDAAVRRANETLRRLGRLLVPINYARTGRFRHDPALEVPPLPDLAPAETLASLEAGSEPFRITLTHLVRGRNRIVSTLREARRVVAGVG